MGRVTEIIHYLTSTKGLRHYSHFVPTYEDEKAREQFRKGLSIKTKGRKRMKPIFDT